MAIKTPFYRATLVGLALGSALMLTFPAAAQTTPAQTGNFELELNAAADSGDGCQLTFVASNNTSFALTKASYEVAVFDADGLVSSLFVFEFGALPLNKTRVVLFSLPEVKCDAISRMLVNRQDECEASDGPTEVCMKALNTSSRVAAIPFGL